MTFLAIPAFPPHAQVMLSEFEEPSYWDQLFGHQDTRRLAHEVLDRAVTYIAQVGGARWELSVCPVLPLQHPLPWPGQGPRVAGIGAACSHTILRWLKPPSAAEALPSAQVLLRPSTTVLPAAAGEAQMSINVLRAAELFCDDSNFKPGLVQRLSLELGQLLSADAPAFKARWRAGVFACKAGPLLRRRPVWVLFVVLGHRRKWCLLACVKECFAPCVGGAGEEAVSFYSKDELLVNSVSNYAMDGVARLEKAARKLFAGGGGCELGGAAPVVDSAHTMCSSSIPHSMMVVAAAIAVCCAGGKQPHKVRVGQQLALERAVLLYKVMGNLHCEAEGGAAGAEVRGGGGLSKDASIGDHVWLMGATVHCHLWLPSVTP